MDEVQTLKPQNSFGTISRAVPASYAGYKTFGTNLIHGDTLARTLQWGIGMAHHRATLVIGLLCVLSDAAIAGADTTGAGVGFGDTAGIGNRLYHRIAAAEEARQLQVEASIPQRGDFLSVGFGSLWMMGNEKLIRVALADNMVTEIPVKGAAGEFRRTIVGEGAIWVADNQTIYKIDPKSDQVVMTIPANFAGGINIEEIGVGEGAIWAVTGERLEQVLRRYSVQTGAEQAAIPLPSPSSRVIVAFGSIWVAGTRDVELYRIDPASNQIVATIDLHARPVAMTSDEASLWVRELDGTVQRIDSRNGKLLASIATEAADGHGDIVVAGNFVWTNCQPVTLVQIDPQTNSRRSRFDAPPGTFMGYSVTYGGGSLWLGGNALFRVKLPD